MSELTDDERSADWERRADEAVSLARQNLNSESRAHHLGLGMTGYRGRGMRDKQPKKNPVVVRHIDKGNVDPFESGAA